MVCYCFGENEARYRSADRSAWNVCGGGPGREHIQAGRRACEVRNPRGVCCLGDVAAAVKRIAGATPLPYAGGKDGGLSWPTRVTKSASVPPEAD